MEGEEFGEIVRNWIRWALFVYHIKDFDFYSKYNINFFKCFEQSDIIQFMFLKSSYQVLCQKLG